MRFLPQEAIGRGIMVKAKRKTGGAPMSPKAKLPGETHLQWVARVTQIEHAEATRTEPLVTPEAQQHATYEPATVTDPNGGTARTLRNRQMSAIALMHERGHITEEQLHAAQQIADVAERIERSVSTRAHSLEPRVDQSGGARDPGIESLSRVRMERTYSAWRDRLPMPKRLVLDMVLADRAFTRIAQRHNVAPSRAKRLLVNALDNWIEIRAKVYKLIEQEDVDRAHEQLGVAA